MVGVGAAVVEGAGVVVCAATKADKKSIAVGTAIRTGECIALGVFELEDGLMVALLFQGLSWYK